MKCSNISISRYNTFKEKCYVCAEYFMGDSNAHFVRHAKTLHKCQLFQCAYCSEGYPSMMSFQLYRFWPPSFFPFWNQSYASKITLKKHDFILSVPLVLCHLWMTLKNALIHMKCWLNNLVMITKHQVFPRNIMRIRLASAPNTKVNLICAQQENCEKFYLKDTF